MARPNSSMKLMYLAACTSCSNPNVPFILVKKCLVFLCLMILSLNVYGFLSPYHYLKPMTSSWRDTYHSASIVSIFIFVFYQASKCGIVESVLSWVRFKAMEKMDKQCHKSKHVRLKGIPKLDDANNAGTKNSSSCTLILTEGDSAKSLAVAGLGVVGRDNYGVFPLRGKLLNVREASSKQIMENAEINALVKILGLQYKNKYESPDSLRDLRYGK